MTNEKYWEEKYCELYDKYQMLKQVAIDMDNELRMIAEDRECAKMLAESERQFQAV